MKKLLLLILSGIVMGFVNMPAKALTNFTEEEFAYKGFSKYLIDIVHLQESRQEADIKYETPKRSTTFWNHIKNGDILVPTQEFGYYDISPAD